MPGMIAAKKKFDTDELRNFYFSQASNYSGYNKKKEDAPQQPPAGGTPTGSAKGPSAASPTATGSPPATITAGSAVNAVKQRGTATPPPETRQQVANTSTTSANNNKVVHAADAVSPEYVHFLKQQQQLVKEHGKFEELLSAMQVLCEQRRDEVASSVDDSHKLLKEAETSSNWKWRSKYNRDQLIKDTGMVVTPSQLKTPDDAPNVTELQHQVQLLQRLKQDHGHKEQFGSFKLTVDNGIRRMERILKEFHASQLDATDVVRVSDTYLAQLDQTLAAPTLRQMLQETEDRLAVLSSRQQECYQSREQALEDGEMHMAERETFRLVDIYEELLDAVISRINVLYKGLEDNDVMGVVCKTNCDEATTTINDIQQTTNGMRAQCEADLAALYKLKKQVDETEAHMKERGSADRQESDAKLNGIADEQRQTWDVISAGFRKLRELEKERHLEVKKRLESKTKEETRLMEYECFTEVANTHAALLDLTVRNMDTNIHNSTLMQDLLNAGFGNINKDLSAKKESLQEAKLAAHKLHLELFRGLFFTLGDLEYKKEKRVEEVDRSIQAAHIQQELCNDSLNPNAKKFSDAKKDLLKLRDDIQGELADVRDRAQQALEGYNPTEEALNEAGFDHKHPITEQEERRLATRSKIVEYREINLGNVSSAPIRSELEELKKKLQKTQQVIEHQKVAKQ